MATVMMVSVLPAMTQTSESGNSRLVAQADDRAAKKAVRQTQKAAKQVNTPSATPARRTAQRKQVPASGAPLSGNVALLMLGASTLVVGGVLFQIGRRTVGSPR
jgi:Flp pilus assembly protein TadB